MSSMMSGFPDCGRSGKVLRVNLTEHTVRWEEAEAYARFIGGRGVASWVLFNEVPPEINALSPGNKLIFSTGPLTGTLAPAAGRLVICNKNAQSGGFSSANSGGDFAAEMRFAGVDHIVIEGKADRPVYLLIKDEGAEIRDASSFWGLTTWATEDAIRQELGDKRISVASIGPAGEKVARIACVIVNKGRAAAWGGCGAVMGSKNLKAVAVRGNGYIRVQDPQGFMEELGRIRARLDASVGMRRLRRYGTLGAAGVGGLENRTPQSFRNMQDEVWSAEKTLNLREVLFRERHEVRRLSCFSCPLYCSHFYRVSDGPYEGAACEGIQANTVRAFGSNLDIADTSVVVKANSLVNQLGMDVDGVAAVVGWAYECFERGVLSEQECDNLSLDWGNGDALIRLIEKMASREGIGDLLADGVARASERLGRGSEEWAMVVKGTGLNEAAVRAFKGWALGIMTSTRAGGHLNGTSQTEQKRISFEKGQKWFGIPTAGDPRAYEGKGRLTQWFENFKAVVDMLGVCYFTSWWQDLDSLGPEDYALLYNRATGEKKSAEDLLRGGEQVVNVEKAFNVLHCRFGRHDDYPPKRLMMSSITRGEFEGEKLDPQKWDLMLTEYYTAHGWDPVTGWQTQDQLNRLGLPEVVARLERAGCLA